MCKPPRLFLALASKINNTLAMEINDLVASEIMVRSVALEINACHLMF